MCAKQFDHSNKEFKLLNPDKLKIACVVSEWHNEITEKLFIGAKNILIKNGVQEKNISKINVPGSFELIFACKNLINKNKTAHSICHGLCFEFDLHRAVLTAYFLECNANGYRVQFRAFAFFKELVHIVSHKHVEAIDAKLGTQAVAEVIHKETTFLFILLTPIVIAVDIFCLVIQP